MMSPDVAKYGLHPVAIITVSIPLMIITTIAISLRIWVRYFLVRTFGKDDVFLILAYVCFLAACANFIVIGITEMHEGLSQIMALALTSILGIGFYLLNQIFFKTSLAFFFLRIVHKRWHRLAIIFSVLITITFNLALIIISIVQCGPISSIDIQNLSCIGWNILGPLNYFVAALNAIVDWVFALTSILVVHELHLRSRDRLSVYGIVALATAGSVVSIVRIPFISALNISNSYYSSSNDSIAYASLVEAAIGIIATSLAVMRPLAIRLLQQARSVLSSGPNASPAITPQERLEDVKEKQPHVVIVKLFQALPTPIDTYKMPSYFQERDIEEGVVDSFGPRTIEDTLPDP